MYSLASCEYQVMNGFTATKRAASSPARREMSSRPHRYVSGITAVPISAENDRSPASLAPNTFVHGHARMKKSGGLGSFALIALNIAPNERCSSCAAWASSNQ